MRIAHIICTFPPYKGGMGNTAKNFSKVLQELGHEVTVITPDYGKREDEDKMKFNIKRLKPFFKYGNAAFLPQIFFKLNNYDIIHLHYPFFGAMEAVLLNKIFNKKTKLILHYHMDPVAPGLKGLIFKLDKLLVLSCLFKRADAIVCGSLDYFKNSLPSRFYEKNKNKIYEIPFGVDIKKFTPKTSYALKNRAVFLSSIDKAHYFKGLENLLRAAKDIDGLKLHIIGGGDMVPYYKEVARELGTENRVNFAGKLPDKDLPESLREADILVLPSINKGEAFGTVLLEAMSSGTPVIASNLPGVRSVFENGKHGFLVEPGSIPDLQEKIRKIMREDILKDMGEAGRKLVEERYDWLAICEQLSSLYKKIKTA